MSKLMSKVIFLDTSIFVKHNYIRSHKLQELAKYSKLDFIHIYITDITYRETIERIKKGLEKAKSVLRNADKTFDKECKVLKILDSYKTYFPIKKVDVETDLRDIKRQFNQFFKKNKFQSIKCDNVDIGKVFDKYFNNVYPFKEGAKKHEFPDAFVLERIENWATSNKTQVYLISGDNDMINFESDNIFIIRDLTEILDIVIREYPEYLKSSKIQRIESIFFDERQTILNDIRLEVRDTLEQNVFYHSYHDIDLIEIGDLRELTIDDNYSIISVDDNDASIELRGTVDVELDLGFYDRSYAVYDREDRVWFNEEYERRSIDKKVEFKARVSISHNPEAGIEFASYNFIEEIRLVKNGFSVLDLELMF